MLTVSNHNQVLLYFGSVFEKDKTGFGVNIHDLVAESNHSAGLFGLLSKTTVHVDSVIEEPFVAIKLLNIGKVQGWCHRFQSVAFWSTNLIRCQRPQPKEERFADMGTRWH